MCGGELTRRDALWFGVGGLAIAATGCARPASTPPAALPAAPAAGDVEVVPGLFVKRRQAWGADLAPKRQPVGEDVRFVLVHHTASPNDATPPEHVIRATYAWQTSAAKGWLDVCYHFFVAPDGTIWEGRVGSIDGPVQADATGGNQGFAQLVCLIGDFQRAAPTAAAQESLSRVLSWLTWRYRLPRAADATTSYVSRGSDRWPAGTTVTTPVVAAHRDATFTSCPGSAAVQLLPEWRRRAAAISDPVFPQAGAHPTADRRARLVPPAP